MTINKLLSLAPKPRALSDRKKHNVFLSYRSVNRPWVISLYDVLRSAGHKVFLDQTHLVAGSNLPNELQRALLASQAGVLVWSKATADSKWVEREYQAMMTMKEKDDSFNFVIVKLDNADLPLFHQNNIFLDFSTYPDGPNGGELLRLLHAVVGLPLSEEAMRLAAALDEETRTAEAKIAAAIAIGNTDRLVALADKGGLAWQVTPTLGAKVGEALAKLGRPELGIAKLESLTEAFPKAIRPLQMLAHTLTRRRGEGDLARAQEILGSLYHEGERDAETLGLYGRTFMDRYRATNDILMLRKSRDLYEEGFRNATDDFYTGINAAAKSVLLATEADRVKGKALAAEVEKIVGTEVTLNMDYWKAATVAEAQLIQANFESAARLYADAIAKAPTERGSHKSSRDQALTLLDALSASPDQRAHVEATFAHLKNG